MSVQMPHLEHAGLRVSKRTAEVESLVADRLGGQQFVENFEALVDAAGSAKQLKELILQLAVSGRLLPTTNETADSLLAELERGRSRLKGLRVGEPSDAVADEEVPYSIPSGWRWIRLRDLGGFLGGGTPSKSNEAFWKGPLPWVSPKDMKRPYIDDAEDHISLAAVEGSAVKLIPKQSILYVVRGMILAHSFPVAVATREVTINQDMKALVLALPELSEFMLRSCQAARARVLAKVERSSHGTCRLESEAIETLPIALPPLAEQKRIVARVDQLMALIDDLEAKQTKKREVSARFTKASLEALTTAAGPEEFDTAWERVVENFPTIIDTSEKMGTVRTAILRLAAAGQLHGQTKCETGSARMSLGDACSFITDGKHGDCRNQSGSGYYFLSGKDIVDGSLNYTFAREIAAEDFEEVHRRTSLVPGDILLCNTGSIGKVAIAANDPRTLRTTFQKSVAILKPQRSIVLPEFLVLILRASLNVLIERSQGSAVRNLLLRDIRTIPIALPPIAEQSHSVAKVEYLMKLCDDLEAKLRRAEERASKLVEAVVREMVA